MGRGGKRPGAGRKKQPMTTYGVAGASARVLTHPSVPTTNGASPIEEFDAPDALTAEERAVWLTQAPHAFRNRTLLRASALSFERYCRVVVMERKEGESSARGGANHRGLMKQINTYELQFGLTPPQRKTLPEPEAQEKPAESKLARYRRQNEG